MLQNEMARARKKIEETRKKTRDIKVLKYENDIKFMQKVQLEQIKEAPDVKKMENRIKTQKEIKEKRLQIFMAKKQEVDLYKQEQSRTKQQLISYREESEKQNYERKLLIRQQLEQGNQKKNDFLE